MLTTLKKEKLHERVSRQILNQILSGELKPGDRLPTERSLSAQLGVSRTAVREAITYLEGKGLLQEREDSGSIVREVTFGCLLSFISEALCDNKRLLYDLLGVRKLMEAEMAREAARRTTADKAHRLRALADDFGKSIHAGQTGLTADNRFHNYVAEMAENSAMQLINEMCSDLLSDTRLATLRVPWQREQTVKDHYLICDAIAEGNAELAAGRMRDHLARAHSVLTELDAQDAQPAPAKP